jgi:hypothetical protein
MGIILGPVAGKLIESEQFGAAKPGQTNDITLVRLSYLFYHI